MFKWLNTFVTNDIIEGLELEISTLKKDYKEKLKDADDKLEMSNMLDRHWAGERDRISELNAVVFRLESEVDKMRTEKQVLLHVLEKRDQDINIVELLK